MPKTIAFVRRPGPSFNQAISANPKNQPINLKRACLQHECYIAALEETGIEVVQLPAVYEYPDCLLVTIAGLQTVNVFIKSQ